MACEILVPQPRNESRSSEVAEQCPDHQGIKKKKKSFKCPKLNLAISKKQIKTGLQQSDKKMLSQEDVEKHSVLLVGV